MASGGAPRSSRGDGASEVTTMETCERCGAQLEVPLVLRVPEHRERKGVFKRSGETLCPEHFDDALAQLEQ